MRQPSRQRPRAPPATGRMGENSSGGAAAAGPSSSDELDAALLRDLAGVELFSDDDDDDDADADDEADIEEENEDDGSDVLDLDA